MHISKVLFWTIIGSTIGFSQSRQISLNDSTDAELSLKQELQNRGDLGSFWQLTYFDSAVTTAKYRFNKNKVMPDSLIFIGSNDISVKVRQRLFSPILSEPMRYGTDRRFREIRNAYAFLNNQTRISYALWQSKPVSVVEAEPEFANQVSGMIGGQRSNNKGLELTGEVQVHLENTWRSAGTLDFHWVRLEENSQKIDLHFDEPSPFGMPVGVGGGYSQEIRSGLYSQTKQELYLSGSGGVAGRWKAGSSLIRSVPTLEGKASGRVNLREQLIELAVNRNSLDDRWLPRSGSDWQSGLEFGTQTEAGSNQWLLKTSHDWLTYISLSGPWLMKIQIHAEGLFNKNGQLSEYQQIHTGGLETIRGYPEQFFAVTKEAYFRLESQAQLNKEIRGLLFLDAGTLSPGVSTNPAGYGIGFVQNSRSVLVKFYYGIGRGDTWSTGKIHFQIMNKL